MSALKPCPFCGGEAVVDGKSDDVRVRCTGCNTLGRSIGFDPDDDADIEDAERDAVAAWNRRAPVEITDAMVEAAERALGQAGERPMRRAVLRAALRAAMGLK